METQTPPTFNFKQLHPKALKFARKLAPTREVAEDLVQEAFIAMHRSAHTFKFGGSVENWMYRIINRKWLDKIRHDSRRVKEVSYHNSNLIANVGSGRLEFIDVLAIASPDANNAQNLFEAETCEQIRNLCANIGTKVGDALYMHVVNDMTYSEISSALNIPMETVRSRIHRTKQFIRKAYHNNPDCLEGLPALAREINRHENVEAAW